MDLIKLENELLCWTGLNSEDSNSRLIIRKAIIYAGIHNFIEHPYSYYDIQRMQYFQKTVRLYLKAQLAKPIFGHYES